MEDEGGENEAITHPIENLEEVFPLQNIESQENMVKVTFIAKDEGMYKIVLSNSHSWMRSKTLMFRYIILRPVDSQSGPLSAPVRDLEIMNKDTEPKQVSKPAESAQTEPSQSLFVEMNVKSDGASTDLTSAPVIPASTFEDSKTEESEKQVQVQEEIILNQEPKHQKKIPSFTLHVPQTVFLRPSQSGDSTANSFIFVNSSSLTIKDAEGSEQTFDDIDAVCTHVSTLKNTLIILKKGAENEGGNQKILWCLNNLEAQSQMFAIRDCDVFGVQLYRRQQADGKLRVYVFVDLIAK